MEYPSGSARCGQWRGALSVFTSVLFGLIAAILIFQMHGELQRNGELIEHMTNRFDQIQARLVVDENVGMKYENDVINFQSHSINKRAARERHSNRLCRGRHSNAIETRVCKLTNRVLRLAAFCWHRCFHPAVHVILSQAYPPKLHDSRLVWQWSYDHIFDSNQYELSEHFSSVLVRTSGLYVVSAQVTFNGRSGRWSSYPCAVTVMRCPLNATTSRMCGDHATSLLYAASMQYNRGEVIRREDGHSVRAYDTVVTSGLVRLSAYDEVYVETVSPACNVLEHPEKTSLQLVRLIRTNG